MIVIVIVVVDVAVVGPVILDVHVNVTTPVDVIERGTRKLVVPSITSTVAFPFTRARGVARCRRRGELLLPAPFGTTPVPHSSPWSVSTPPPVTPDMGISAIRRCQPTQREGLWGGCSLDVAAPRDSVVGEESPIPVNLVGAPRGPVAPTSSLRLLSAREAAYFHLDLPPHEAEVLPRISPAEEVYPAAYDGVDELSDDLPHREVESSPQCVANLLEQLGAFLLSGSAQDHLLARLSVLVYPAKRVAEKVKRFS